MQSIQSHFLRLYASPGRQCKLGYDSSAQCDSFQLGEMVRFFTRVKTLQIRSTLFDTSDPPEPFSGNLLDLIDTLRQVPEYQIDKFHTHCGVRTRITLLLDMLQDSPQNIAICLQCWQEDRRGYA